MGALTLRRVATALMLSATVGLAGCGSSAGLSTGQSSGTGGGSSGGSTPMAGMGMGGSAQASGARVASHVIGTQAWQGMKIQTGTAAPVTFYVPTGEGDQTVAHRPPQHVSFQLTVALTDRRTGVQIPYASVRAKILDAAGTVVYDGAQWPMLSPSVGSYYGDNVALPRAGRYTLELTISPPVGARHMEYAHVWTRAHTLTEHFRWPAST